MTIRNHVRVSRVVTHAVNGVVVALLVSGCSCGSAVVSDAGFDAGSEVDAALEDSALDDAADAFVSPDVLVTASMCGGRRCDELPDPERDGRERLRVGRRDGVLRRRALPTVAERRVRRRARCVRLVRRVRGGCEAAGHCDAERIFFAHTDEPVGCATPLRPDPACTGGWDVSTWVPLSDECNAFREHSLCYGSPPPVTCVSTEGGRLVDWDEVWTLFRRASLLPFVVRLTCGLPGP